MSNYYVTQNEAGKPAGSGTEQNPWNGLTNINWDLIVPGSVISLAKGLWEESLEINGSGSPTSPIIIKGGWIGGDNYDGFSDISGGKQLSTRQQDWTHDPTRGAWLCSRFEDGKGSGGNYAASVINGTPIPRSISSDFRYFHGSQSNARFRDSLFIDSNPWDYDIRVAVRPYNLLAESRQHIRIYNCHFSLGNGWNQPQRGNVHLGKCNDISFHLCKMRHSALAGLWVTASDYVRLHDCDVYENFAVGWYWRAGSSYADIQRTRVYRNGKYLSPQNNTDTGGALLGSSGVGRGHQIEDNELFDNGAEPTLDNVEGNQPNKDLYWGIYRNNIWQKNLKSLKRWDRWPVYYLGFDNVLQERAENADSCSESTPWFFDKETTILYLFSIKNPNDRKDSIEIGWERGMDPALSLWQIRDSVIRNNHIHHNYSNGLGNTFGESQNNIFEGNKIHDNILAKSVLLKGRKYGMAISGQGGFTIINNEVYNNGGSELDGNPYFGGVILSASSISPFDDSVFEGNKVYNNGGYQLSWPKYLSGDVYKNIKSEGNSFCGKPAKFYYVDTEYVGLTKYQIGSCLDKTSEECEGE